MSFFTKKSVVGLDLDYGELRAVELTGKRSSPRLIAGGRVPLPLDALDKGMVIKPEVVGEALTTLWRSAGFKSRETVMGISNQGVVVRFASFPKVPEEKLNEMIRQQARGFLPIPLEEAVLDYSVIGENKEPGEKETFMEILLVAAQHAMVTSFTNVLKEANLKPRDINISSLALLQLIPPHSGEGAVAFLNLNNGASSLLVALGESPRLARHLSSGLKEAAEQMGCSLEDVVTRAGAAPGEPFPDAFIDWGETLVGEVRSSIGYYQAQPQAAAVEQLILSGRGARINSFPEQLGEIFGIPVTIADPMGVIKSTAKSAADIHSHAVDYAVSFALARSGLEV